MGRSSWHASFTWFFNYASIYYYATAFLLFFCHSLFLARSGHQHIYALFDSIARMMRAHLLLAADNFELDSFRIYSR